MKLAEAKQQFIGSWGAFGTQWGINRTMAQIHALLLVSAHPITQDEIMSELSISRGNVNMNIRELVGWGLVDRVIISGARKEFLTCEYFQASKHKGQRFSGRSFLTRDALRP
jgi:DNA-binding transcriptional regulator GbsR (MarR family)